MPTGKGREKMRLLIAVGLSICALCAHAIDPRLAGANDWLYVLQHDGDATPAAIAASDFDVAVMDYSFDGGESGEFAPSEIAAIQTSGKIVLAYMSIGEAGDYRFYWDPTWNDDPPPDPDAPAWLGPENPDFPGDFKVRYWDAAWQSIIFGVTSGPNESWLDRVIDQGFDGVYLDIIDAFQYWSDGEEVATEKTRLQARTDMVAFVAAIADHARTTRGMSDFLVFPQNAVDIIVADDFETVDSLGTSFLGVIDGIGAEDTFYDELTAQPSVEVSYTTGLLDLYRTGAGATRLVINVDYTWDEANPNEASNIVRYNDVQAESLSRGYVPYVAVSDRDLNKILSVSATGGFAEPQPKPAEGIPAGLSMTGEK